MTIRNGLEEWRLCRYCWNTWPGPPYPKADGSTCRCRETRWAQVPPPPPERADPFHLCTLCARAWAPLNSRWSWLACHDCVQVNVQVARTFGASLRLPLGRHSFMNGGGVQLGAARKAETVNATVAMWQQMSRGWQALDAWRTQLATEVWLTRLPSFDFEAQWIPVSVWESHADPSWPASCESWLAFQGLTSFEEFESLARDLYASGVIEVPDPLPPRGWRPHLPTQ